jgi:hypothetical protein
MPVRRVMVRRSEPSPGETPEQTIARLQAENDAMAEALEASRFEGAVARGQLQAQQGEHQPWPADLDPSFAPEGIEATLAAVLADYPELSLAELDCSEYPCVARLDAAHAGDGFEGRVRGFADALKGELAEDAGLWLGIAKSEEDDGTASAAISMAVAPKGDLENEAILARTDYRAKTLMESGLQDQRARQEEGVDVNTP